MSSNGSSSTPRRSGCSELRRPRRPSATTAPHSSYRPPSRKTVSFASLSMRPALNSTRLRTSSDRSGNAKMVQTPNRPATAAPVRGRILLVDDDPGLLRLLSIRLRAEHYDVEAVESAAEALASLTRFRPDLVITDLRMESMDG